MTKHFYQQKNLTVVVFKNDIFSNEKHIGPFSWFLICKKDVGHYEWSLINFGEGMFPQKKNNKNMGYFILHCANVGSFILDYLKLIYFKKCSTSKILNLMNCL